MGCASKICMLSGQDSPEAFPDLDDGADFSFPDFVKHCFQRQESTACAGY